MQKLWPLLAGLLAATLVMCSRPQGALTGRVLDVFGRPLSARISVEGTTLRAQADTEGYYVLPYVPGHFQVRYELPDHEAARLDWELLQAATVPVEDVVLLPTPPDVGVWVPRDGGLQALEPSLPAVRETPPLGEFAPARRTVVAEGPPTRWCLGLPLLVVTRGPVQRAPVSAWVPGSGSVLWTEGLERQDARPAEVTVEAVSERIWRLDPKKTGPVVILPEGDASGIGAERLLFLEVGACR